MGIKPDLGLEDSLTNSMKVTTPDLDNLKTINDTYGHKWGDIYIKAAVGQLKTIGNDKKR